MDRIDFCGMTPATLIATLTRLGLSQSGAARLIGVSRQAVSLWIRGERPIPGYVEKLLALHEAAAKGR